MALTAILACDGNDRNRFRRRFGRPFWKWNVLAAGTAPGRFDAGSQFGIVKCIVLPAVGTGNFHVETVLDSGVWFSEVKRLMGSRFRVKRLNPEPGTFEPFSLSHIIVMLSNYSENLSWSGKLPMGELLKLTSGVDLVELL